jgi:predicted metal-binding membrane protein
MWVAPRDFHNRVFFILMVALITLAWLALWIWSASPYASYLDHEELGRLVLGGVGEHFTLEYALLLALFVSGWALMVVAMMLPTSLPLVLLFHRLTSRRSDRSWLVALLICGYLAVWTFFGGLAYFNDLLIHETVEHTAWLEANSWVIGAATVTLAGVYQFTPLKYKCLEKCRSPLSFITEHWQGKREVSQALRLGVHHGLFCLGCCWSLMLVMFAVGAGSPGWMLALGAVMATEKNVSWGRRISAPLGVALLGWGVALALGEAPALH